MQLKRCPKCNGVLAPSDRQCLDCGEDIAAHLAELHKAATSKKELTHEEKMERARNIAASAARGRSFGVDKSEETRLRTFDKAAAETTKGDIGGAWGTAAIALVIAIASLAAGFSKLNLIEGIEGLKTLSLPVLRDLGFGMFADIRIMCIVGLGTGTGALLCTAGQIWRAILAHQSVAAVARGEKPVILFVPPPTRIGLLLIGVSIPPVGIIMGICFKAFGKNDDVRSLGSMMVLGGIAIAAFLGLNMLGSMASDLKAPEKDPSEDEVEEAAAMIRGAIAWVKAVC